MGRIAFLALALLVGGISAWGYAGYTRSGPLTAAKTVIVPRGAGVGDIARRLTDAGVLSGPLVFRLGVTITGADKSLRAGEYAFPAGTSPRGVSALLRSGNTAVRRLTVPEGLTTNEILAQLNGTEGLEGDAGPPPAEGSLLPETYHFAYGDRRDAMVRRMAAARDKTLAELWAAAPPGLPLKSPGGALILASMVEKETARPDERRRVAAVFLKRLRRGMRLQSDPTVIYGLTRGGTPLGRPLSRADLSAPSPYNTYLIDGLPPSPIANPGRAAIAAVLNPALTDELYFVADGSGGHVFARTLAEHNRNVAAWRKIQKQRRAQ